MKNLLLLISLSCAFAATSTTDLRLQKLFPKDGIEVSNEWTEYTNQNGIKIEYKMTRCEDQNLRAQNNLLFRFTNTTNQELTVSWITKVFRNDECWNCDRLDNPENEQTLTLAPQEVIEGKSNSDYNKSFYIFGNFIKMVPGMTKQRLTNFEFVDLTIR